MPLPVLVPVFLKMSHARDTSASGENAWSESQALYSTLIRAELREDPEQDASVFLLDKDIEEVMDETVLLNHMVHGSDPRPYELVHQEVF